MHSTRESGAMPPIGLIIVVSALVVALGIFLLATSQRTTTTTNNGSAVFPGSLSTIDANNSSSVVAATSAPIGTRLAGTVAPLLDFQRSDYENAVQSDKLVVLYFYANWCPICREEFPKMQEAFNRLRTDMVIGFRVNYNDSETDDDERGLAQQFGVAYQHTKVFVKDGMRILKAPDSWDASRYLTEINAVVNERP